MRYAVYFTPAPDDPLTIAAQCWLGRDVFTGKKVSMTPPDGFSGEEFRALIDEPRRYGFHATLVAPFRLREDLTEKAVIDTIASFAQRETQFVIPHLSITQIGSFFALTPAEPEEVGRLASAAVDHCNALRAPLNDAEIERRRPARLTVRQRAYLDRFGYPYVKDEFRFHMTLTGSLRPETADRVRPMLEDHFAPLLERAIPVDSVALFVEPAPGADFVLHSTYRFGAAETRKRA